MEVLLDQGTMTFIIQNTAINSSFVVLFVNSLKALSEQFGWKLNPEITALVTNIVVVALTWVARALDQGVVLDSALKWGEMLLPALVNLILVAFAGAGVYKAGKVLNVPGVGYKPEKLPG